MQYLVRNRRRLRPTTGNQVRTPEPPAPPARPAPAPIAEGSGAHRRPLVITEINHTRPLPGRGR
jgi:hypothetical protein